VHFSEGIRAQPTVLTRSRAVVTAGLDRIPPVRPGDVVALVGVGASDHAARTAAVEWRAAGLRAYAVSAAELATGHAGADVVADVVVAISESGRSAETLEAARQVRARTTVAVVNDAGSPLARACDAVVALSSGPDSPIYTTGYTATLQALGLLGARWSGRPADPSALGELARLVLDRAADDAEERAARLDAARIVDVVGSPAAAATVGEGALLLRESARLLTAAHETRGYLHGPMEPLDPRTALLVIGNGREVRLARDTAVLGCPTVLLTTDPDVEPDGALDVVRLPRAGSPLGQAVLDILPVQLLAEAVARRRGLAVDGFRYRQDDTKTDGDGR
jgi:glucosamine--fructose-6-phosphate aminotransferase (isomerizing)